MIKVEKLTKIYPNSDKSREGIANVSFEVKKGEVVSIIGPSGSGKSTLLSILAGIRRQDSGTYSFDTRKNVGYVSQEYTLWPHLNVLENLTLAPLLKNPDKKEEINREAKDLITRFGLGKYVRTLPHELSGGQRQRVALLRSIMIKPDLLLLDEITSSLDPELTKSVLDLVRDLAKEGYTMLIVTHHMSFSKSISDKVLFLESGQVVVYEDANTFFNNQNDPRIKSFIADIAHEYEQL